MTVGIVLTIVGYLFGSVSSAIIVCRALGLPDPRSGGSKNPGATNVLRLGGRKAGALTLAGDFLKGLLPVLLARALSDDGWVYAAVGVAAFLGHLYPLFFGFRGGKGVATGLGVLLGWSWLAALLTVATWLVVAMIFRISSVAALTAFLVAPAYVYWATGSTAMTVTMGVLTVLTFWRHRSNISGLISGREQAIARGKDEEAE
ncbi:glycerol-3-phosphate 1-O-acyltransferase PlsY [Ectothiorhodospiraceae bacterium WFHF3C12]|nr:glycerol-3-phosphate 1-O-acyltransferase PlsY [Ectothiorhodospiraceae bacterium WFHF3C12]